MHSAKDPFGNAITLQQPESAAAVRDFVEGFLAYEPRVLAVLAAAEHDASLIVQACAAALYMFSESPSGVPRARAHLQRAAAAALPCTERERLFASAVQQWVDGQVGDALATHALLARGFPRDLAALKLGQYHAFNLGDAPTMLRLALQCAPAAPEVAWLHGMLAFGHEQCHNLAQAEAAARHALRLRPAEPWAEHALAHVMLTEGRHAEGAAFMQRASAHWQGLSSFMRCHNWWHLALFQIELGDTAAALALFDQQVWGVDKSYSQDQVGAVSLLARLELAGLAGPVDEAGSAALASGPRWDELATHLADRVGDQVQPFLDLQYLYGLARAQRPEADALLANMQQYALAAPPISQVAWQQAAMPAARGLVAHARGQWAVAADELAQALPWLARIGGSHAQRELFEQVYRDALARSGQWATVLNLVKPLANAQPQSRRLAQQLAQTQQALNLPRI